MDQGRIQDFNIVGAEYGSTGCGVFKRGIQNQKDFFIKINIPKGIAIVLSINKIRTLFPNGQCQVSKYLRILAKCEPNVNQEIVSFVCAARIYFKSVKVFILLDLDFSRYCNIRMGAGVESVQDFLIKLDMKPCMHLMEISIFSLNLVIIRPAKIMNRANKNKVS